MSDVVGLLVKVRTGPAGSMAAVRALGAFEPILEVPAGPVAGFGLAASQPAVWVRADAGDNPWDRAHALLASGFAAHSNGVVAAEPDFDQQWNVVDNNTNCVAEPQTGAGGRAVGPHYAWHLDDGFSGLRAARATIPLADQARVTIAHLDTGYDPAHAAAPRRILTDRERNFIRGQGENPNSAVDVGAAGLGRNPGHGTGTIGILAGGDPGPQPDGVTGPLGGAPGVKVLPIRIANSVVRFTTATMVQGFGHARQCGVDVVSMSMGGLASSALADAINLCYEDGIVLVTAAGNFLETLAGVLSSPRSIVYPARMRRVLAATGVMADGRPYFGGGMTAMQGCHGPDSKMETAVAGWTPNIPWPERGCGTVIDLDGQGTSAATPQVAAAAALWIARHREQLAGYPEKWMKGEAARQALLASARKTTAVLNAAQVRRALGGGAINALAALAVRPMAAHTLRRAPVASAAWDWLKLLTGQGVGLAAALSPPRERMLGLEILQIAQRDGALEEIVPDPDRDEAPDEAARRRFLERVRESASRPLKRAIDRSLGLDGGPPGLRSLAAAPPLPGVKRAPAADRPGTVNADRAPENRRLRIFALDPSLGGSLDTVDSQIATVNVRYERNDDGSSALKPGPVGEYLEVVDIDPASDMFYPPVDLDDPHLLLQDGLAPSEGNPEFHQQMVYAVAMRTITSFEEALGRRAIWAPHRRPDGGYEYVPRLRVYPHALRAKNAYYSPGQSAILFGYFPAESRRSDATAPGTIVFGCLSADIVAHEMTHALLDGYTTGFKEFSNADVGSFHEAFADVVALFQHFQYKDLVRREIARSRGNLSAGDLLGGLARQFGHGLAKGGPLRDYRSDTISIDYRTTFEVHDRGSLLVQAIYQAYLAIFERRTGDLIRLATGGSGVLAAGEIHPDLVNRLTDEACKAAGHVLRMCIRALDYLAPVDVTFGDYLRALITADLGQVKDDRFGYRTALIESFRRRDLLPTHLRTVSVETLQWQPPAAMHARPAWLKEVVAKLGFNWQAHLPRWEIHKRTRNRCRMVHGILSEKFARDPELCRSLGLKPGLGRYAKDGRPERAGSKKGTNFEVRTVRGAYRQRPDGTSTPEIIIILAQRRPEPFDGKDVTSGFFWYGGGTTLVIDPSEDLSDPKIKYSIGKRIGDEGVGVDERLARERDFRNYPPIQDLRALYFGDRGVSGRQPFAALHATED